MDFSIITNNKVLRDMCSICISYEQWRPSFDPCTGRKNCYLPFSFSSYPNEVKSVWASESYGKYLPVCTKNCTHQKIRVVSERGLFMTQVQ